MQHRIKILSFLDLGHFFNWMYDFEFLFYCIIKLEKWWNDEKSPFFIFPTNKVKRKKKW